MSKRRRDRWHTELMAGYYAAVQAEWQRMEAATMQYPEEMREWFEQNGRLTFKRYLLEMRENR